MKTSTRPDDEASVRMEARLLRWDAAIRRSAAESQRAEAARSRADAAQERARAARQHADHLLRQLGGRTDFRVDERDRIADERESEANERDRIADERESEANERERIADEREAEADDRQRLTEERELSRGMRQSARLSRSMRFQGESFTYISASIANRGARLRAAGLADRMAREADAFAGYLEKSATPSDRQRKLAIARTEREIARIERQNAVRLRRLQAEYEPGEPLPKLPRFGPGPQSRPAGVPSDHGAGVS